MHTGDAERQGLDLWATMQALPFFTAGALSQFFNQHKAMAGAFQENGCNR